MRPLDFSHIDTRNCRLGLSAHAVPSVLTGGVAARDVSSIQRSQTVDKMNELPRHKPRRRSSRSDEIVGRKACCTQ